MDQQKEVLFTVGGMHCAACSSRLERVLNGMDGVQSATVSLAANSATVVPDPALSESDTEALVHQIEERAVDMGFTATPVAPEADMVDTWEAQQKETVGQLATLKARLWPEFGFTILLLLVSMGHMWGLPLPAIIDPMHSPESALNHALLQLVLTLPVLWSGRHFYLTGLPNLWRLTPNMDSLVAMGTGAAFLYSLWNTVEVALGHTGKVMDLYYESAAVVLTLVSLGKFLESRNMQKTKGAITALMQLSPDTAILADTGREVPTSQLKVGDVVLVKPGARVPADGTVTQGESSVNEAMLTGESLPVEKAVGSEVIGGSVNENGVLYVQVTRTGDDSTLSRIIRFVEDAQGRKAPISKTADKVAGVFVPVVMGIALLAAVIWAIAGQPFSFVLRVFTSVLVIACPCALGLATPTAIMVGTGLGAKHGILIRSGEILEITHSVDTVVLDKTGTVTEGTPAVTEVLPHRCEASDLLSAAAAVEAVSAHPLATAITAYAQEHGYGGTARPESFENLSGRGLKAVLGGETVLAGNRRLLEEHGVDVSSLASDAERLSAQGQTPMYFARGGTLLGLISVADPVKETSAAAIQKMRGQGIRTVLLTGDNRAAAEHIGSLVGVDEVIAEVLPEEKAGVVERLQSQGRKVMMVGDGINDAPALTAATVGCAIGSGSDIAIESADIVLMRSDLQDVPRAIRLSRLTLRDIKQNLFWAFCYNTIGIPIAAGLLFAFGGPLLSPMFAGAAMSLSSVCVVGNALRLGRAKL